MTEMHLPFLIPVLALSMMLAPTPSQAIVAVFNPVVLVAGLASFLIGSATFTVSALNCLTSCSETVDNLMAGGVYAALDAINLIRQEVQAQTQGIEDAQKAVQVSP